ncbi:hypothetical protein AB0K34_23290 [Actinomadura sp. NPDC049382]|uniref:hypothetical protein n=1 Tax=Actinomadura sp. NPDC049382 TaxID=3158220 RepID=UPI003441B2E3
MPEPHLTEVGWAGSVLHLAGLLGPGGPVPEIELVLRDREEGGVVRVPAAAAARDGAVAFEARVDVASITNGDPLPGGLWEVRLAVGGPAGHAVLPLRHAPGLDASPRRLFLPGSAAVIAYFDRAGALAVDVGGRPHAAGSARADLTRWNAARREIVVAGHLGLREISMPVSATLVLSERRSDRTFEVIALLEERPGRLSYTAAVPVSRAFVDDPLPRGAWDVSLCLGFSGMHRELRLLAAGDPVEVRVWRRLRHVRVASSAAPGPLTITVD